jgi:carboxypeptidase C (cathepsin A)
VLMSGLLNFQTLSPAVGNDLPFVISLPSFTAVAHYHKKLAPELQANREQAIAQSRIFAGGEYASALLKGELLEDTERRAIAQRLAYFSGLSADQVLDEKLRVDPSYFREMLLRKEGKILGRFDARVTSEDADRSDNQPEFDPSFSNIIGPFSSAVNAYIRGDLGYESDQPYQVLAPLPWRYSQFANRYLSMENALAKAMKRNPKLRVVVLVGRCDLAVPENSMRYSIAHLPIPQSLRANILFQEFESGHMMYLFQADAEKLRRDLVQFVRPSQ